MFRRANIVLLLLFLLASFQAVAEGMSTGIEFLRACTAVVKHADGIGVSPEEGVGSVYCLGYLSGFTDSVRLTAHFYKPQDQRICLPEQGASNEQLARVVTKWLRDNPNDLHESTRLSVMLALQAAFPCKKN